MAAVEVCDVGAEMRVAGQGQDVRNEKEWRFLDDVFEDRFKGRKRLGMREREGQGQ